MTEIDINIKSSEKNYPIIIENESIIDLYKKILSQIEDNNYLVVISEKVEKIYGKQLPFPKSQKFILKDGEKEKNFNSFQKILNKCLQLNLTRKGTIIAIGGGVCGDLAGFASSVYMRGINLIQVPTTLLACTDSSVGGKTAINTKYGKNLIGTFYQPKIVYINPKFLKTLDEKQLKSGLGEVIKYSFIEKSCKCNEEFNLINLLNEKTKEIFDCDEKILSKLIEICVKLKKSVIEQDEKENNLRRILNFGHTYGHAVEKTGNYNKFTHGEAVIEGVRFVFDLALKKNVIDKNYKFFAEDLIKKFNFKKLPEYKLTNMIKIMKSDKKANKNNLIFVLPVNYSEAEFFELSPEELTDLSERK